MDQLAGTLALSAGPIGAMAVLNATEVPYDAAALASSGEWALHASAASDEVGCALVRPDGARFAAGDGTIPIELEQRHQRRLHHGAHPHRSFDLRYARLDLRGELVVAGRASVERLAVDAITARHPRMRS